MNCSQSTNDAYPTAIKLVVVLTLRDTLGALQELKAGLEAKSRELADVLKMGRTENQDAVPMTLGQELGAYAVMVGDGIRHLERASDELLAVNMGATAIGTGINSPPGYAELCARRLALVGTIGARLQIDGAAYGTSRGLDPIDGGAELRRLRFGTRGDFHLLTHTSYAVDLEVVGSEIEVGDVYLWWANLPWVQRFKIGNFTPPMALESVTASRDLVFMETGLPVEAFGPARSTGVEIGGPQLDQRLTWAVALVRTLGTTDQGDKSRDGGRGVARVTWLPEDDREARRLTHLGVGASMLFAARDVRYETRPESHLAPSLVDTGVLPASKLSSVLGLELLHVRGPWLAMSEWLAAVVGGNGTATFWGMYALASYAVTGESQPYDRTSGILARFVPARPFSWHERAWGALRAGGRVSHIDLSHGGIAGGRETDLMGNLTWVLNRWLLLELEYGLGFVRGRPNAGNLQLVQTRLQIDFY